MGRYLINRNYARLWYGQAVSTVGDYVFDTTLVLWIATVLARGRSWAPAAVSGVLLSVGSATLIVGPVAGVFVDRWNRKLTMLHSELIRAGLVVVLLALSIVPARDLPTGVLLACVYAIVFAVNAVGQFFSPARFATIGEIVPGDVDRARAAGIGQATTAVAAIIGPPLAAPLLFGFGVHWAMLLNALSYVWSYFVIRSVPVPGRQRAATRSGPAALRREFVVGLHYFARSRILVSLLTVAVIAQGGTGALNTLNVFFTTENLHASAHEYGLLSMAFGAGAVIGALLAGRVVRWVGARTATWSGLIVSGGFVCLYSRQTVFAPGIVVLMLLAIPVAMMNTAITPLLLRAAPPEMLGRVVAVFNPINELASMLSVVIAGWLASTALHNFRGSVGGMHLGPIDAIFAGAGVLIGLAGCYAYLALPREGAVGVPVEGAA
ncbi:MAG TPA: MFS transporter [Mycobacterium sp.]|uniref:MFS transporter n=1 Tax=Mycobacterium sp. TaxID=1785 RepID=UPI002D715CDA|nr:MFS transporter [Mycobacterium sp.]HZU49323.1 MFS transporter [Mycobacterium sp.]